eukprot:233246-Rhodomonas_salina.1
MQAFRALAEPKALPRDNNTARAGALRQRTEDEALLSLVERIKEDHGAIKARLEAALQRGAPELRVVVECRHEVK